MPQVHVAVIDNDPLVLEGLTDTLKSWGCCPIAAQDLHALEEEISRRGIRLSLLVTDLHLSRAATGLQAIEQLRRRHGQQQLPAILLTGDLDPSLEHRTAAVGRVWLAHKPLRPARLRELVLAALRPGQPGWQAPE